MSWRGAGVAKKAGLFGWSYNRENFKYDQGLRWQRYTTGRKMAVAQAGMFREDVTDLAAVAINKMKVYAPILTMSLGYCITVFVEGRSGLKFPGPPTFVSGLYLQCIGVGFAFMTLATWLVFHSALRAQMAATQLRTRTVRLPVPTQRHLDGARMLLSSWEEQSLYDNFRIPFAMPQSANPTGHADAIVADQEEPDCKGDTRKMKGKAQRQAPAADHPPSVVAGTRLPGLTKGAPSWIAKEMADREDFRETSPSAHGKDGATEPFEHFEYIRQAQKEYWGAEAYSRVCFLFGFMHLIQSFCYWLVLHAITDMAMIWCANVCAAGLCAGIWLVFRLDVLPEYGGGFPIEASGPFVAGIALQLGYAAHPTPTLLNIAKAIAILVLVMQILWTFRLYAVAKPTNNVASKAKESGGQLFNESASCELPSWLPHAFQHSMYLVAPPKSKQQVQQEEMARPPAERSGDIENDKILNDDPMSGVDMTPWYYTRTILVAVIFGWSILLIGRIVEAATGERMWVTNPGHPPWTRAGQWFGWEHGPISSKHYAHITPQKGHFAYQKGWGPQGQQELWASDMFGFHPEADAWWAEPEGPEPRVGAAGIGKNTWYEGVMAYGADTFVPEPHEHDFDDSGGHRRLNSAEMEVEHVVRAVVPAAVQWPKTLEPDLLLCGSGTATSSIVAALTFNGLGAIIPAEVVAGQKAGTAATFVLKGLVELGMLRGVTWGNASLLVVTESGAVASCSVVGHTGGSSHCSHLAGVPRLPVGSNVVDGVMPPVALLDDSQGGPLRAAVASGSQRVALLELSGVDGAAWQEVGEVVLPYDAAATELTQPPELVAIAATKNHLVLTAKDGVSYKWRVRNGQPVASPVREVPGAGPHRTWRAACALSSGKILRLASSWRRSMGGAIELHPELLI